MSGAEPVLEVDDVVVDLGGRRILDGVSFSLAPGELTGLIGSNGAGKTTLLRVILGLQRPGRGAVRRRDAGGRRPIGYVPQKVVLDPDLPLRAWDLVELGIDGHRFGLRLPSRARREAVDRLLAAVGADHLAGRRVGRLSGGEQQRVLIAHALAGRPDVLLLDEPLANLDLASTDEVVQLLHQVSRTEGVAVLLSAHDINPLLGVMDRVVYLAAGRAAAGPTDEVVRTEVLSRLYAHHVEVLRVAGRIVVVAGPGGDDGADCSHPAATTKVIGAG